MTASSFSTQSKEFKIKFKKKPLCNKIVKNMFLCRLACNHRAVTGRHGWNILCQVLPMSLWLMTYPQERAAEIAEKLTHTAFAAVPSLSQPFINCWSLFICFYHSVKMLICSIRSKHDGGITLSLWSCDLQAHYSVCCLNYTNTAVEWFVLTTAGPQ